MCPAKSAVGNGMMVPWNLPLISSQVEILSDAIWFFQIPYLGDEVSSWSRARIVKTNEDEEERLISRAEFALRKLNLQPSSNSLLIMIVARACSLTRRRLLDSDHFLAGTYGAFLPDTVTRMPLALRC